MRCAYVSLVAHALQHCRAAPAQRDALTPTLTKAVEKAAQQPLQVGDKLDPFTVFVWT